MAITHPTNVRDAMCNAVVDLVDVGAGTANLVFWLTDGTTEVATLDNLPNPAFGASSSGTASALGLPWTDTSATGNASPVAKFTIEDRDGNPVILGEVSTSGSDINLSSTTIAATDQVSLTALTYSAPS